ncbi:3'(2'),5'-bisphosphate nucleotidase CysQ [Cellvibrio polysaccharolyticus]|nr:3'(2'),5'-bisphosphate nucleotidase CysQ [Cellvibrio polysaccharolyticus]
MAETMDYRFRDEFLLMALVALAREAGDRILEVYQTMTDADIAFKSDDSPVTAADIAAHHCLADALPGILAIPLISEEGEIPALAERLQWRRYWLIDPLDGTREFITRNGEFTVNIALIEDGKPVLGVVHVPVHKVTYAAINLPDENQVVALKIDGDSSPVVIHGRSLTGPNAAQLPLALLASHRHERADLQPIIEPIEAQWPAGVNVEHAGSSLKFCWLAEGRADLYPRHGLTSEWDTAASQAVLEAAGGAIVEAVAMHLGEWQPLAYNNRESLLNPFFYAVADRHFDWSALLQTIPVASAYND